MLTLKQEIPARIRVRAQMDEGGALALVVQVSAPYGESVTKDAPAPECSVRLDDKVPPELVAQAKAALEQIRAYTEAHCALDIQRAIFISRETALRLEEIKEA